MTTTLKQVHERQQAAERARDDLSEMYDRVYWDLDQRERSVDRVKAHPDYVATQAVADRLTAEVAALREQVGGKVFRVVDSKLGELADRIAKLNKKAVKLGTEAIILTVSTEKDQKVTREMTGPTDAVAAALLAVEGTTGDYVERVTDYTFVTVNGETPMIKGWVFVASLDHEADEGADVSTAIRRAPVGTFLINRIGEEAAAAVENADLTVYRHAGNDCDHCGYSRRRRQTYVLYEVATGELRQIGSTCLRAYTGADNPERVAAWAEWLEALYGDLGGGDYEGGGEGSGRIAVRTVDYLANVVAVIKDRGWQARWRKSDYGDSERNYGATADVAMSNYFERDAKLRLAVTDEDRAEAEAALEWVRELDESDGELSEFEHNLTTYCRSNYVPQKGDGFVAYAPMARRRAVEKVLETERKAKIAETSEWIGQVGERLKGVTITVTFTRSFEGAYGVSVLTKGYDADGNQILWFGKGGMEQGKTYELSGATIKAHETDSYNGGGKVTKITNVRGITEIKEGGES